MKPTIDDIINHFKNAQHVQHPKTGDVFDMSDVRVLASGNWVFDNGTGGYYCFMNPRGILLLYSGTTNQYSKIIN